MNIKGGLPSEDRIRKLAEHWKHIRYLIIDEYSMISREFLAMLSKILSFPPVKGKKRSPLYFPTSLHDSDQQNAGSELYRQFTTVFVLRQQMRVKDPEWQAVLQRARHGKCEATDLELLRNSQIDMLLDSLPLAFTEPASPWAEAFLVTPRNGVRKKWNATAVRQHCRRSQQQLLICPSEDTKKGRTKLSTGERLAVLKRKTEGKGNQSDRLQLEEEILLAKGLKVMLVTNVQTDFDMANGARGTVVDIILDPREAD
ncbi:hypothetical protein M378DRAFT_83570, partial [Amanita muscaria Koide BX008]